MRKEIILGAGIGLVTVVGGAAVLLAIAAERLNSPLDLPADGAVIEISPGSTLQRVTNDLAQRGILSIPRTLDWYARLTGTATQIKVGEYRLAPGATPVALIEQLVAGRVVQHQFTIVEGWRFTEMLQALRSHEAITATLMAPSEIMHAIGSADVDPEGQFLPDTYSFPRGTLDIDVLGRSHDALNVALEKVWSRRSNDLPLQTPYEALILASIVEKETALASERPLISGVFNRRLRLGIRLQTDPTVIYGLGDRFDGNLRRTDLTTDSPYNTYTRAGLPPTPIALPGIAALEAAVNPAEGDALYFVATGLGDGSHYFSATLEEHNRAVERYLRELRNREQ